MIVVVLINVLVLIGAAIWGLYLAGAHIYAMARRWGLGIEERYGFFVHPGLFYHPGHTWIARESDGTVRVGLDDFGRRLVDGICKVVLPAEGSMIRQGAAAVELDCGNQRAALQSPIDGVVIRVNRALTGGGTALERDPYGKGWLFTAKVANESFSRLPTGQAAFEWMEAESGRLAVFLNDELGATAADGGELIPRPARVLSAAQWEHLTRTFLGMTGESAAAAPLEKGEPS